MRILPTRRSVILGAVAVAAVPIPQILLAEPPVVHEIEIRSFQFDPKNVEVRIGDTIRWINKDLAPHTATADEFGWDTETLERNETASIEVTEGMETSYFCVFHPHMKGRIVIIE